MVAILVTFKLISQVVAIRRTSCFSSFPLILFHCRVFYLFLCTLLGFSIHLCLKGHRFLPLGHFIPYSVCPVSLNLTTISPHIPQHCLLWLIINDHILVDICLTTTQSNDMWSISRVKWGPANSISPSHLPQTLASNSVINLGNLATESLLGSTPLTFIVIGWIYHLLSTMKCSHASLLQRMWLGPIGEGPFCPILVLKLCTMLQ